MDNFFKGIINRIDGDKAIISIEDGQTITWPIEKLPKNSIEGAEIKIFVAQNKISDEEERTLLAKNLLNEILDVDE
ncbi:MAG: hypothetical protein V1891_01345 [bacterium]